MKSSEATRRIVIVVLFILISICYFFYIFGLFQRVPINSDYANLVLEAADVLNGNVFLSDWNLTGITFATTDLLFFIVGVLFSGVSINAYYIAITLMFVGLIITGGLLLRTGKKAPSLIDFFILIGVGGLPSVYASGVLRAHTVVSIYVFLGLFILSKVWEEDENSKGKNWILLGIFTLLMILASAGDQTAIVIGIVPIMIVAAYELLSNNILHKKMNIIILILCTSSLLLGKILDKVFVMIGDTNKNSFIEGKSFGTFSIIAEKFKLYLTCVLGIFDGNFLGEKLLTLNTLFLFLRVAVILLTLFVIIRNIISFIRRKNSDKISVIISIGMILISLLFIMTDIAADIESGRYIGYFGAAAAVLIVRYFKTNNILLGKICNSRIEKVVPIFIISAVIILGSIKPVDFTTEITPQDRLADFLVKNDLKNGYAKFWNASHTTVASGGKAKVRAIIYDGAKNLYQFKWFCKNSWYNPDYSNFVVIEDGDELDEVFKITKTAVQKSLGKPSKILTVDKYTIYVYNFDITDKILK